MTRLIDILNNNTAEYAKYSANSFGDYIGPKLKTSSRNAGRVLNQRGPSDPVKLSIKVAKEVAHECNMKWWEVIEKWMEGEG